jgi:hypothetical protein
MRDKNLLEQLKTLLKHKKGRKYYAAKLGISEKEVGELLDEIHGRTIFKSLPEIFGDMWTTTASDGVDTKYSNLISSEVNHNTGESKFTFETSKPLQPDEIKKLVGADDISIFVDRSWLKSHKNNTWTYSILTSTKIKDFYSSEELSDKLKDIFKETLPKVCYCKKPQISPKNKALFIYIADDHVGNILKYSLYHRDYSDSIYCNRLLQIVDEVKSLNQYFSEINIIRLGDELDGWNSKTTRADHELDSLSNKEQFDIYTASNKVFYDSLLQSGIGEKYNIYNLCNSNHSGNHFSYIANKALEFWMEAKFPDVKVVNQTKFIDVIKFGNHIIGLTHGKDEKYMKSPMPLNLDYKTDLWLMEYYKQHIFSDSFISTIKGDIHKFNINQGKSGRYVNVPSISSGSNWIEHNYGDSEAGCLVEIYSEHSKNIQSIPIWF